MQQDEDSKSISVVDDLIQNHGWIPENIGPPGQRLRLDVVGNIPDVEGVMFPHQLAPDPSAKPVQIRKIFTTNREVMFSSEGLKSQSDFIRQRDQDGWKQYLIEGASPKGLTPHQVVDKWFRILRCQFPDVTLQDESGRMFEFPLLVLTDPDNVKVRDSTGDHAEETGGGFTYEDLTRLGEFQRSYKPHPSNKDLWAEGKLDSDPEFVKKVVIGAVVVVVIVMALMSELI
jgi:hypothetical protein